MSEQCLKTTVNKTISNSATSTSIVSTSKSTKSTSIEHSKNGELSKSSSSSSLQISDVSHLPTNANFVRYTVTESLPAGAGEKITVCNESGATSTEYRHSIAQDYPNKQSHMGDENYRNVSKNRKYQLASDANNFYGHGGDPSATRNSQLTSDTDNFYGHGRDSSATVVKNVYDSKAVQNTIGTRGRIIMDNTVDSSNLVYSNDRNYGKTGWNGKFV